MKMVLGYIYREPQIILQRAACASQAAGWPPLLYYIVGKARISTTLLKQRQRLAHILSFKMYRDLFYISAIFFESRNG